MRDSNSLRSKPTRMRVLGQGSPEPAALHQQLCLRCGNTWWPRRLTKPRRCARCKSPYWDRPRQVKPAPVPAAAFVNRAALTASVQGGVAKALGKAFGLVPGEPDGRQDRSLANALQILKEMKAAGRTWAEMAARLEQEFGTRLDKEQLKALVR